MTEAIEELSTAQLLQRATEQTTALVRAEIHLAQLELSTKAKRAGLGLGALGATGVLSHYAVGVLLAAAVLGLSTVLPGWLAALIVGAALLMVAAVLALVGKKQLGKAIPPAPTETIASTREDVAVIKNATHR
jgi:peptidoglycan/LPS O-acetylase OafA/YrhL